MRSPVSTPKGPAMSTPSVDLHHQLLNHQAQRESSVPGRIAAALRTLESSR